MRTRNEKGLTMSLLMNAGIFSGSIEESSLAIDALRDTKLVNIDKIYHLDSPYEALGLLLNNMVGVAVVAVPLGRMTGQLEDFKKSLPSGVQIIGETIPTEGNFSLYRSDFAENIEQVITHQSVPKKVIKALSKARPVVVKNVEFCVAKTALIAREKRIFNLSIEDFSLLYSCEFIMEGNQEINGMTRVMECDFRNPGPKYAVLTLTKEPVAVDRIACSEWVKSMKKKSA